MRVTYLTGQGPASVDLGPVIVPGAGGAGSVGPQGEDGLSAYELAVASGFVGSQGAWLASLQGSDGSDGAPGADGASILTGVGVPASGLGRIGDTYIDTATGNIYSNV